MSSARMRIGAIARSVPGLRGPLERRDRTLAAQRDAHEASMTERDRELIESLRGRKDLLINVGSSSEFLEGWINVDIERDPDGRCIRFDAAEPWPFDAGSARAINSEHVIEHLDAEQAERYFAQAFRALAPGGVIRTSTPDLEGLAQRYAERDPKTLDAHRAHGYSAQSFGDFVNNYFYMYGHRRIYDFEMLRLALEAAGFTQIERAEFGHSRHPELDGIDQHDPASMSGAVVCVDAVKPG